MTRLAWYKRDPAAFLDGTMALTLEETGAYTKVLELIYVRDGACPDNARWIAGHLNCDVRTWRRLRGRLIELGKLYLDGETLRDVGADSTIASGLDRLEQTIMAGRRSGEKRRKPGGKPGNFNGSGGTPVPTSVRTTEREIKTQKEKKESNTAAAVSRDPRAGAREEAAAAVGPSAKSIPLEADFLGRVEACGHDPHAAAKVLAAWKAEFREGYPATLEAVLARVKANPLALAELKFGDLRRNRQRAEEEARQQHAGGWSVEGIAAGAAERVMAARDAWTVTSCPQLGTDT